MDEEKVSITDLNYDLHLILKKWHIVQHGFPQWAIHRKKVDLYIRNADARITEDAGSQILWDFVKGVIKDIERKMDFSCTTIEPWGSYLKLRFLTNNEVIDYTFQGMT